MASALLLVAGAPVLAEPVLIDGGRFDFSLPPAIDSPLASDGLSGIAYLGDDQYLLVSDSASRLRRLRIELGPAGKILRVEPDGDLVLRDEQGVPLDESEAGDREDLALDADGESVWVVNERCGGPERGPCLERFRLADGRRLALIRPSPDSPLGDFEDVESNRGFESLVMDADGGLWAGLERPLPVDREDDADPWAGPIRLQHFSSGDRPEPLDQYAFAADPVSLVGAAESEPWQRYYGSRLVALLAPPDLPLIAVVSLFQAGEAGYPETLIRFYALDRSVADDTSRPPFAAGLAGREFSPARKTRIGQIRFDGTQSNFEGAALGPRLPNGDWAVLLVRDNDRGADQSLYSVRLRCDQR